MSDFLKKDISDVKKLISSFTNIKYDISDDMNDYVFTDGGILEGKYAVLGKINLSGYFKSKETLHNAKHKGYVPSPLENIYDSYERELKMCGITYEDFEAIMFSDQSMLKELGVESWVISDVIELFDKIEKSNEDWFYLYVYVCIPLKDYTSVYGYDFDINNYDEEDLISQFNDCDCYGVCVIDAGYNKDDDYGLFYDEKEFIEKIGTVKNHSVKNLVEDALKYCNLK